MGWAAGEFLRDSEVCNPMFSGSCRVYLRLNGLSFGQGDDCGGEDYVEVDGIPFCDAVDVTSLRE